MPQAREGLGINAVGISYFFSDSPEQVPHQLDLSVLHWMIFQTAERPTKI
jgi:hypothetical protein